MTNFMRDRSAEEEPGDRAVLNKLFVSLFLERLAKSRTGHKMSERNIIPKTSNIRIISWNYMEYLSACSWNNWME